MEVGDGAGLAFSPVAPFAPSHGKSRPQTALLHARTGLLDRCDSLPPKRKFPAKVATKWPLGTFMGVETRTPQHRFRPMFTGL